MILREDPCPDADDPSLPHEWRAALHAGANDGPTAAQAGQLRAAVLLAIAHGAADVPSSAPSKPSRPVGAERTIRAGTTSGAAWIKPSLFALILVGSGTVIFATHQDRRAASGDAEKAADAPPGREHSVESSDDVPADRSPPEPSSPAEPSSLHSLEETTPSPRPPRRNHGSFDPSLETELLHQAHRRVETNPRDAMKLLSRHERLFPASVLSQEREVIAIEALVGLGKEKEATLRAREFVRRHPESTHARRVRRWVHLIEEN